MFDPESYCGDGDETKLINAVERSLVGVNFFFNNAYATRLYYFVRLICFFSKTLSKTTLYKDGCFMKVGTKAELLKVRGYAPFDRLDNSKMKRRKKDTGAKSKSKTKNCD